MMYKLNINGTNSNNENYYYYNNYSTNISVSYNGIDTIKYNPYGDYNLSYTAINLKDILNTENVANTSFVPNAEEKIEEYIYEHFDKYDILEMQEYIYQVIQEKAYDIVTEMLEDAKEDYDITNEDDVIETIIDNINFDSLYEIVDEIMHSPRTMEEKLADVGMSYKDFL